MKAGETAVTNLRMLFAGKNSIGALHKQRFHEDFYGNVDLVPRKDKTDIVNRANRLFDMVNISPATRKKLPSLISGGEAQRAGIVRAAINSPTAIFADEPTGALNSHNSNAVLDVFSMLNEFTVQGIVSEMQYGNYGTEFIGLYLTDEVYDRLKADEAFMPVCEYLIKAEERSDLTAVRNSVGTLLKRNRRVCR